MTVGLYITVVVAVAANLGATSWSSRRNPETTALVLVQANLILEPLGLLEAEVE